MPEPDFLLVCQSAAEHGNLLSMLDAGISHVMAAQLPASMVFTLAARFYWTAAECGQLHTVSIRVEHPDGERLMAIDAAITPRQDEAQPGWHPRESLAQRIVVPLSLDVRRPATYSVKIVVDGDDFMSRPLEVTSQMPPV